MSYSLPVFASETVDKSDAYRYKKSADGKWMDPPEAPAEGELEPLIGRKVRLRMDEDAVVQGVNVFTGEITWLVDDGWTQKAVHFHARDIRNGEREARMPEDLRASLRRWADSLPEIDPDPALEDEAALAAGIAGQEEERIMNSPGGEHYKRQRREKGRFGPMDFQQWVRDAADGRTVRTAALGPVTDAAVAAARQA